MLVLSRKAGQTFYVGAGSLTVMSIIPDRPGHSRALIYLDAPGLEPGRKMFTCLQGHRFHFPVGGSRPVVFEINEFQCMGGPSPHVRIGFDAPDDVRIVRQEMVSAEEAEEIALAFGRAIKEGT